jgi:hypothetical protein
LAAARPRGAAQRARNPAGNLRCVARPGTRASARPRRRLARPAHLRRPFAPPPPLAAASAAAAPPTSADLTACADLLDATSVGRGTAGTLVSRGPASHSPRPRATRHVAAGWGLRRAAGPLPRPHGGARPRRSRRPRPQSQPPRAQADEPQKAHTPPTARSPPRPAPPPPPAPAPQLCPTNAAVGLFATYIGFADAAALLANLTSDPDTLLPSFTQVGRGLRDPMGGTARGWPRLGPCSASPPGWCRAAARRHAKA